MHLCAAIARGLPDLLIERQIGKRADGNNNQIHAALQNRNGHFANGLDRRGFHDVFRIKRQQRVHIRADRAADCFCRLLRGFGGTAGYADQLVILKQTVFPCICHDVAQKTAADNAEFRLHMRISFALLLCNRIAFIISWMNKKSTPFLRINGMLWIFGL